MMYYVKQYLEEIFFQSYIISTILPIPKSYNNIDIDIVEWSLQQQNKVSRTLNQIYVYIYKNIIEDYYIKEINSFIILKYTKKERCFCYDSTKHEF